MGTVTSLMMTMPEHKNEDAGRHLALLWVEPVVADYCWCYGDTGQYMHDILKHKTGAAWKDGEFYPI